MNQSCAGVAPEVNEFELSGLHPAESKIISTPRVAESPVTFECLATSITQLNTAHAKKINTWMVLGEVVAIHIDKALIQNGIYETALAEHVLRGGGPADYFTVGEDQLFQMYRPS